MYSADAVVVEHPDGSRNGAGINILLDGSKVVVPSIEPPVGSRELWFEKPLIIDPVLDYLEKARFYFDKIDYPTCANYQRKWCERFLKSYLQKNYRLEIGSDDTSKSITKLGTLYNKLKDLYNRCGVSLPEVIIRMYPAHRDSVMNPFSHDDVESPIYRYELEQGFILIEEFKKLKNLRKSVIAYRGDIIEYVEPSLNYRCRFQITSEPLSMVNHGGAISILGRGDVVGYTENGIDHPPPPSGMSNLEVNDFCTKIAHHLSRSYPDFTENPDKLESLVLQPRSVTLRELANG